MSVARSAKVAAFERALETFAETVGDVTRPAMDLFYRHYPEAMASFEHHGLGRRDKLEVEMVDNALYCLVTWLERPAEVRITINDSVPHHEVTLKVTAQWYDGLLASVIDVIAEAIPAAGIKEREVIGEIRAGLARAVAESRIGPSPGI